MSSPEPATLTAPAAVVSPAEYAQIQAFLYREGRLLDDKHWDEWLTLYAEDAEFWMPAWDDSDELTTDPQREISLIYYPTRAGIEDRVFRIKTDRSSASMPEPRTIHQLTNLEILDATPTGYAVRFNWHTLSYRYKVLDSYFGCSFYELRKTSEGLLIARKKVILKNDYIRQVIDVYHL